MKVKELKELLYKMKPSSYVRVVGVEVDPEELDFHNVKYRGFVEDPYGVGYTVAQILWSMRIDENSDDDDVMVEVFCDDHCFNAGCDIYLGHFLYGTSSAMYKGKYLAGKN